MHKLVFLPGFLGAKEDWEEVISFLPKHNCLSIDLNEKLPEGNFILVGYSMGGRRALHFQYAFPERVQGVIAIGAHPGIHAEEERKQILERDEKWADLLETLPFEEFLERWYEQPLFATLKDNKEIFEKMLKRRRQGDPLEWAKTLRNWSAGRIKCLSTFPPSTYFLYGEHDEKYKKLYKDLPSAMIEKSGHAAHLENPQECARLIDDFVFELTQL